jgi:uncharacterized protein YndB with AHSA1/START domain
MTNAGIQDSIVFEINVSARPERVFEALTHPDQVPQWWGGRGAGQTYRCTKFERELRVGGRWLCTGVDGAGGRFEVSGEYLQVDPPNLLVSTWKASWTGEAETTIRWELAASENGTRVKVCHSGFAAHPEIAMAYRGWPQMLGWLQAFVDAGESVSSRGAH